MQYQKYLSYLIFIISLNSCTTWHYTNYGKSFDFLKAQRVSCKSQETSSNDLVQPFPSMAKMESKKSNSNKTEKQYSIEERYIPKNRLNKENSIVLSQSTNQRLIEPPSLDVLFKRLKNRATENEKSLNKRIEKATHEMKFSSSFDLIIINDKLEEAKRDAFEKVSKFLKS